MAEDALQAVLRSADGRGDPTTLTEQALAILGYDTPEAILRAMVSGRLDRGRIHALCPAVFCCAEAGDEVSRRLVVKLGQELALYATASIHRLGMEGLAFDVVLSGSVFKGRGTLLVETIAQAIRSLAPQARIVRPRFEPAVGAVLLALDALGIRQDERIATHLERTQPSPAFFDTAATMPGPSVRGSQTPATAEP